MNQKIRYLSYKCDFLNSQPFTLKAQLQVEQDLSQISVSPSCSLYWLPPAELVLTDHSDRRNALLGRSNVRPRKFTIQDGN